jgi:hypothetical protein
VTKLKGLVRTGKEKSADCSVAPLKQEQEHFWRDKGMAEARKALNKRRQNTNNAMKKVFLGKDGSASVLVLFANNS